MPVPSGPTQRTWYRAGYQQALADVLAALDDGGEDAARVWITNNLLAIPSKPAN